MISSKYQMILDFEKYLYNILTSQPMTNTTQQDEFGVN